MESGRGPLSQKPEDSEESGQLGFEIFLTSAVNGSFALAPRDQQEPGGGASSGSSSEGLHCQRTVVRERFPSGFLSSKQMLVHARNVLVIRTMPDGANIVPAKTMRRGTRCEGAKSKLVHISTLILRDPTVFQRVSPRRWRVPRRNTSERTERADRQ